jgi:hypothetical protein
MADHLGVAIPWKVDGRSLRGARRTDSTFPMFEWSRNVMQPPPGEHFLIVKRGPGFAAVRRARAAAPNEFADLRVFRVGRYANLLGTVAKPDPSPDPSTATLDGPLRYLLVNQGAVTAPYAAIHGISTMAEAGRPLAVAVNGVVAGLSFTYRTPGSDHTEFWGTLVPRFFHNGRNFVQVYAIDGPVDAPRLHRLGSPSVPSVPASART